MNKSIFLYLKICKTTPTCLWYTEETFLQIVSCCFEGKTERKTISYTEGALWPNLNRGLKEVQWSLQDSYYYRVLCQRSAIILCDNIYGNCFSRRLSTNFTSYSALWKFLNPGLWLSVLLSHKMEIKWLQIIAL